MRKRLIKSSIVMLIITILLSTACFFGSCKPKTKKELTGFDIELAKAVTKELGIELHSIQIKWENKVIDLDSKNIDVVWNGMTILDDLKQKMYISQPYLENIQTVVVKKGNESKYNTKSKILASSKVAVETGGAGAALADSIGIDSKKLEKLESQAAAIVSVNSGVSDLAIVDSIYAKALVKNGDFKVSFVNVSDLGAEKEDYGIGFRKTPAGDYLRYMIEKTLFDLQEKGTVKKIAKDFGLEDQIQLIKKPKEIVNPDKSDFERIKKEGIKLGYTVYEPIAYEKR